MRTSAHKSFAAVILVTLFLGIPGLCAARLGDVTGDGKVDILDAIVTLQVVSNQPAGSPPELSGDINGDGKISLEEALYTIQTAARLRNYPALNPIGNKSVNEGGSMVFAISASDPEGNDLTFFAQDVPNGADFDFNAKVFSWSPTYSQSGTYQVTFQVVDTDGYSDSETITITVNNVPATEAWQYTLDGGQGGGNLTLTEQQDGSVTVDTSWTYFYYGASATGSFTNGSATIAGTSASFSGTGTATHPYAPPAVFTMNVNTTTNNGAANGTYVINFSSPYWPPSFSGSVAATRTSGSGITQ